MTDQDVSYWKERAEAAERDLQDLTEASEMVERELELELKQTQDKLKTLDNEYNQLKHTFEEKDERLITELNTTQKNLSDITREVEDLRSSEQFKTSMIRQLECTVDNLENQKRNMLETIRDLEHKLADQLEETALLEADLEKKNDLAMECQRLRDQARDLTSDLMAEKKRHQIIQNELDEERVKLKKASQHFDQASDKPTDSNTSIPNSSTIVSDMDTGALGDGPHSPQEKTSPLLRRGKTRNSTFHEIRTDISNIQNSFHDIEGVTEEALGKREISSTDSIKRSKKGVKNPVNQSLSDSTHVSVEQMSTPNNKIEQNDSTNSNTPKSNKKSIQLHKLFSSNNSISSKTSSRKNSMISPVTTPSNTKTRPKFLTPSNQNKANRNQTAVGLVGDLLTKIHALENKLTTCRQFIKESPWRNVAAKRQKRNEELLQRMDVDSPKSSRTKSNLEIRKKSKVQGFQTAV